MHKSPCIYMFVCISVLLSTCLLIYFFEGIRVVNGPHFEDLTRAESEITSLNPARSRHLVFEVRFKPKANFTEWVKISATAKYQKTAWLIEWALG